MTDKAIADVDKCKYDFDVNCKVPIGYKEFRDQIISDVAKCLNISKCYLLVDHRDNYVFDKREPF